MYQRLAGASNQPFPYASSAIFAVTSYDAQSNPTPFTDPVDITVQFMDGTANAYNDLVDFAGLPGPAANMRVVYDALDDPAEANFQFVSDPNQVVDQTGGINTVRATDVADLTDRYGVGVWGAVINPTPAVPGASVEEWRRY